MTWRLQGAGQAPTAGGEACFYLETLFDFSKAGPFHWSFVQKNPFGHTKIQTIPQMKYNTTENTHKGYKT